MISDRNGFRAERSTKKLKFILFAAGYGYWLLYMGAIHANDRYLRWKRERERKRKKKEQEDDERH